MTEILDLFPILNSNLFNQRCGRGAICAGVQVVNYAQLLKTTCSMKNREIGLLLDKLSSQRILFWLSMVPFIPVKGN
jgi:hypothetical protein